MATRVGTDRLEGREKDVQRSAAGRGILKKGRHAKLFLSYRLTYSRGMDASKLKCSITAAKLPGPFPTVLYRNLAPPNPPVHEVSARKAKGSRVYHGGSEFAAELMSLHVSMA